MPVQNSSLVEAIDGLVLPSPDCVHAIRNIRHCLSRMPQVEAVVLTGSCTRGQANFGTDIDINVITATENALRLTQEADALVRRKCALIARVYGVLVDIDIKALNGATDASDDIFFDHEIDVAHLCIYGVPLFTDGMRYATLRTTCHYQYTNNLRARHTATALERASRKLALIRSRPDVADPAVAHEDLTLAGRYLFVAGFFYLRRYPVSFEKHFDWQCGTILDISDTSDGFKRAFVASSEPNPNFYRQEMYESLLSELYDALR